MEAKSKMPYDATKMKDWQISEAAEANMPTPWEFQEKLGLKKMKSFPWADSASSIS